MKPDFNAERVCPVLAAPAMVSAGKLKMRLGEHDVSINAPRKYLVKLFDWCNGERSLDEIGKLAELSFRDEKFVEFLVALLRTGIMIDAVRSGDTHMSYAMSARYLGRNVPAYERDKYAMRLPPDLPDNAYELPPPQVERLAEILSKRKSAPAFSSEVLSVTNLASLLNCMYGKIDAHSAEDGGARRTVPSAGGQYALGVDLIILRAIGDISTGAYRVVYCEIANKVGLVKNSNDAAEIFMAFDQPWRLNNAAGVVVLSADFNMIALRYKNKAFAYAMFEAGSIMQNAGLLSAEQGLGLRVMGGFDAHKLATICGRTAESLLTCALIGSLQNNAKTPEIKTEFSWFNELKGLPFHIGRSRVIRKKSVSEWGWGRDTDPKLAYDKALAETLEREAYQDLRNHIIAPANALAGEYIDPNSLVRYSQSQYRRSEFPFSAFDPKMEKAWVRSNNLFGKDQKWVLADCVFHFSGLHSVGQSKLHTHATSSGCATHRTLEDAIKTGLFELIERDAFMRHWLMQKPGISIQLNTLPEALFKRINKIKDLGCIIHLKRLDLSLWPVFMLIAQHHEKCFTAVSAAAGGEAVSALASAFSELETMIYARLAGMKPKNVSPKKVMSPEDHSGLFATKAYYRRADALLQDIQSESFGAAERLFYCDLQQLLSQIDRMGYEACYIDLSMDNTPSSVDGQQLHSVRTLIPGLIPISFGYGRLPLGMGVKAAQAALFPHPFP